MTFSLAAFCRETGRFGVAVASSSPAVAARCAHVRAGVGAVATQNVTDPRLGPKLLDRMEAGLSAPEAMAEVMAGETFPAFRQLLAVDAQGRTATHSGPRALGTWAVATGADVASGGNLLAHQAVPAAIVRGFGESAGALGDRLLRAMRAGLDAGGEAGPIRSAGLLIADRESWPWADLRCDWTEGDPLSELERVWAVFAPQADAYVRRALSPGDAPSFGVPGDR